jgi:hypothetical protein
MELIVGVCKHCEVLAILDFKSSDFPSCSRAALKLRKLFLSDRCEVKPGDRFLTNMCTFVQTTRMTLLTLVAILLGLGIESAFAQSLSDVLRPRDGIRRPTLFQWSYGTSFSGGPPINEDLATDRPDFTEASSCVGRRVLQIETGYTYFFDNDGASQSILHSYPEALFRYGFLTDWLELRIATNFAKLREAGASSSGAEDLYLGVKLGLTPQEGIFPEMALVPQMLVPSGSDELTNDRVLPGVNWLYGWDLTDATSVGASTQFNQAIDDGTGSIYTKWAQSGTFNAMFTDKLGGYSELFCILPSSADTQLPEYYFDGGFFYRFTPNVQWDIRSGVGLNEAANDYFIGSGLSMRFR